MAAGQITSLNDCIPWFDKVDQPTLDAFFRNNGCQLSNAKDSSDLHILQYSAVKTEMGVQPRAHLFLSDSAVEMISFETYNLTDYKNITAQLKAMHFRSLGANVNGNYITTVYDNDRFLVNQDYEAVENPSGKGQLSYYRYRIYRKNGRFDELNGEKTVLFSENGRSYIGIRENYKNGVLSGERTFYYPSGTIKRKENYQAGRLNGLVSDYNEEGKLTHSVTHSYHWKYGMEKWYNNQGSVVKTLQWQRDLPVGTEKQTYNGTVVMNIPHVKGVKQGLAKVPVYYDQYIETGYPLDTLNGAPIAIETVNYLNGQKEGKAVCLYFNEPDTMYVAYYKAGKLDSTFMRYGRNSVWYTTTFADGLENGTRIYRIPSGPLKDTIYRVEDFKNGKLNGMIIQYYSQEPTSLYNDPDPGFHVDDSGNETTVIPGEWVENYHFESYKNGVRNGPFSFRKDSLNYNEGSYLNGKLFGRQDAGMVFGEKQIRTIRYYSMNGRTGEWITNYVTDSIIVTENYQNDKKHGTETKTVKGKTVEKRRYVDDFLMEITVNNANGFDQCELVTNEIPNVFTLKYDRKSADTSRTFRYIASVNDYPESDSTLLLLKDLIDHPGNSPAPKAQGPFEIITPGYTKTGMYRNGQLVDSLVTTHHKSGVIETIVIQPNVITPAHYYNSNMELYTGNFTAATTGESISVKDGFRNGWCIQYDKSGKEISRMKYVKGVAKKTLITRK